MKTLIIGNGGREHAIAWKLYNEGYKDLYCLPGNAGISQIANCFDIKVNEFDKIKDFCIDKKIDFVVIGPDNPLADGLVDYLTSFGIKTFGPTKKAALIESSKVFAKELMKKYQINTAKFDVFYDYDSALKYIKHNKQYPIVIKADGLALGKGVIIAYDFEDAFNAINSMMREKKFGQSGEKIVIEEYLEGEEVSIFVISDGKNIVPLISARDHKKVYDGDKGPNTGGMGAFSPTTLINHKLFEDIIENIMLKTIYAMKKEGNPFKGVLYGGLILTKNGPMVLEFNARFGDPEAQTIMPLMKSELMELMHKSAEGNISGCSANFINKYSVCVVLVSKGYPEKYELGFQIKGLEMLEKSTYVFHANTKIDDGKLLTAGGRVLNICCIGNSLSEAKHNVYKEISKIHYDNIYFRKDIGQKEL